MEKLQWCVKDAALQLGGSPLMMGVVNATPDSFSDGNKFFKSDAAIQHCEALVQEGADILDIGGESTRPGAKAIAVEEERERVLPVIQAVAERTNVCISVDTRKAEIAKEAVEAGAHIINDVSGMYYDPEMFDVVRESNAGFVLMHMRGTPETMQQQTDYTDVCADVAQFFKQSLEQLADKDLDLERIVLDPGIGFSKTAEQSMTLIAHLDRFRALGRPALMGVSRKSFIGRITGVEDPTERVYGSAGAVAACVMRGADILRVHDVYEMKQAADVAAAIRDR